MVHAKFQDHSQFSDEEILKVFNIYGCAAILVM